MTYQRIGGLKNDRYILQIIGDEHFGGLAHHGNYNTEIIFKEGAEKDCMLSVGAGGIKINTAFQY